MVRFRRVFVFATIASALYVLYVYIYIPTPADDALLKSVTKSLELPQTVHHIAVVSCGQRLQETLTMIKSALLFNHPKDLLRFLVFAEDHLADDFREKLNDWRGLMPQEFDFEILPLRFPPHSSTEWRNLFKPCAAQRLFLPSLLQSVDALLYVDTDILFLSPVADIWRFFDRFNASQIAALTPEHEDEKIGWYNRFARHPFYGHLGVNSGVMLMNLTRMRNFKWEAQILPIHKEYKLRITWGDQDIINILFYFHPDKLYVMPCEYNYRPDHCMYMSVCNASTDGIKMLHGNRGYFHSKKQPLFRAFYDAVQSYQLGTHAYSNFLIPLQTALEEPSVMESNCAKITQESLKIAKQVFLNEYSYDT